MPGDEVLVCLHCHSSLSDGTLSPEQLAEHLAGRGVRYTALTDHDTVAGLAAFRGALSRRGIGVIDGVEMTAASPRGELHLLAYAFDPADQGLATILEGARRHTDAGVQGLMDSLKRMGGRSESPPAGVPEACEAIRAVHAAGGVAFLAHPLSYSFDRLALEELVRELTAAGLDGLEAVYSVYSEEDTRALLALAGKHGLAVSAGTDYHGPGLPAHPEAALRLERGRWESFRALLLRTADSSAGREDRGGAGAPVAHPREVRRLRLSRFAARIILPTATAIALFIVSIFALIIPRLERTLLERKKEMIRELTNSAVSMLAEYAADEQAGRLRREEAQGAAAAHLRGLRYSGKDYFWITDLHPTMIMHPYRPELEGQDVSGYADANGVKVFVEFVKAVREREEGYVEYLWQWMDDSQRIVPKLSFVKRFPPWDWVVGTGVYLEDVNAEIGRVTGSLIRLCAGITVVLALLLVFVAQQSLAVERRRRRAEGALRESHERYRALVEASGEGLVVVLDGACAFANKSFQRMLGYTEAELALHGLADLVRPYEGEEAEVRAFLAALARLPAEAEPPALECVLAGRGGRTVDAVLTASPIRLADREGAVLTVKDVSAGRRVETGPGGELAALWQEAEVGMFRAAWGRRAFILDANPAARRLFGITDDGPQVNLFSLIAEAREAERLFADLTDSGAVRERELTLARPDGATVTVWLSAALTRGEDVRRLEGLARDVTQLARREKRREELIAELESSSLFLSQPVQPLAREVPVVGLESPIRAAASRLTRERADCALVAGPTGDPVGILTDRDLRERVIAAGADPQGPVREIMSSPLLWVSAGSLVYEAVLRMRDREINHLLVRDSAGRTLGVVRSRDLLQLQRQSPALLSREIAAARSVEEAADARGTLVELVRGLLQSGAGPRSVCRVFSSASDLIVQKLVELAGQELGEPPSSFAFLALGSAGREEPTPGSDQDNALLFSGGEDQESARRYFLALGQKVCGWLAAMGVPPCPGGAMAGNPSWCATLQEWESYFARWVRLPEPRELLDFNIFFDLRAAAGNRDLVDRLHGTIAGLLAENPPFFLHHARDALQRRLPSLPKGGSFDTKEAMAPIVSFARLYALRHGVRAVNTCERLEELRDRGGMDRRTCENVTQSYTLLLRLRLASQLEGRGNLVDLSVLPHGEQTLLREAVDQLALLAKRIGYDFLGGPV